MIDTPLVVRTATPDDLDALLKLSRAAGQGMTNLPPCREGLACKLAKSAEAMASSGPPPADAMLMLALDLEGEMRGSGALFPKVGVDWPFYSFRISALRQTSRALGKTVTSDRLVLVNDYDGYSEVGGLVVDPALRGMQAGRLIARSRYLFLAEHRGWFAKRVLAELRGWHENGRSPVWEALGRPFYEMDFAEADRLGVGEGKQMIADLGPKHPLYLNLLPPDARAAIGKVHKDGRAAEKMLLDEGFRFEGCVDIFDGGPTMAADVEALKGVRESRRAQVIAVGDRKGGVDSLVSAGRGAAFRAARGMVTALGSGVRVNQGLIEALRLKPGDEVRHVPF